MITTAGGTRPEASAINPVATSSENRAFGAASGAKRTLVIAISTHEAMTITEQAPRTCDPDGAAPPARWGSPEGPAWPARAPRPGRRNPRNEVAEDDDVEPEGTGRGLANRDGAVQLFVSQYSSRNDKVLSNNGNGREPAERQRRRPEQQQLQNDCVHESVLMKAAPKPPATMRITNCGMGTSNVMTNVVTASATPRHRCC